MQALFPEALVCDPTYPQTVSLEEINARCEVVFVCVPTPNLATGALDTSIVEEVVAGLEVPLVVIRSTVQPGTCDRLEARYGRPVCMQPEYLGETVAHPLLDETQRKFLVIGGEPANRRRLIELYQTVYNANVQIVQLSALEAEVVKLSENRAIAWKVAQCHELYEACEAAGVDYYAVREAVYGTDPRFDLWFSFAYPGNLGFESSKCLSKDVPAWCAWAESAGYDPVLTRALVARSRQWAQEGASDAPYTCDNLPHEEETAATSSDADQLPDWEPFMSDGSQRHYPGGLVGFVYTGFGSKGRWHWTIEDAENVVCHAHYVPLPSAQEARLACDAAWRALPDEERQVQ